MNICKNCVHIGTITIPAQGDWLERETYTCHRFPPANGQGWPDIELEDFCGEFKLSEIEGQKP